MAWWSLEEENKSVFNTDDIDASLCNTCGLSRADRIMIFVGCFIGGWLIGWLAFIQIFQPVTFAILYTIGNLVAISGGFFLSGPCSQLKSMCKKTRAIATCIYVATMIMTLYFALNHYSIFLVIFCAFAQFLASTWYTLSYIPYARDVIKRCIRGFCQC